MIQATDIQALRSYRAFGYPITANAWDLEGEEGSKLLQSVQLKAVSSEDAEAKVQWVTGMNVYRNLASQFEPGVWTPANGVIAGTVQADVTKPLECPTEYLEV